MELDNSIDYHTEWLVAEDYETRILILVSILADNDLAFRGTIPTMEKWLGLSNQTLTRDKIIKAIQTLEKKEYIYTLLDDDIYTITISKKGIKDKKIVKLRKEWIEIIKDHKKLLPVAEDGKIHGAIWSNLLKVFVICRECKGDIVKLNEITNEIGMSSKTFSRCIKILNKLDMREYGLRLYT